MSSTRPSPEVRIGEPAFVADALAADLETDAHQALTQRARFTIAIPGGSVATSCFPRLSELALDWSMIDIFWVDERAVSSTSSDSNYAVARSLWLGPAGVPDGRVHRMEADTSDLDRAAQAYADDLARVAGDPPRLDWVLLGVGPDGHVASLFPGHPALRDTRSVVAIENAPKPPPRRLSLSLTTLTGARHVVVVAFGEEKAAVIRESVEQVASALPVARLLRAARKSTLILDRAAGSLL